VILSTGAGLGVPFFLVGRLQGIRLVYVESLTRTERLSLSGRLVAPLADELFVQWPRAAKGRARYVGSILSSEGRPAGASERHAGRCDSARWPAHATGTRGGAAGAGRGLCG
jgi:hypothetical protein